MDCAALVETDNLSLLLPRPAGEIALVREVTLSIRRGEIVGLVGESGSGKSVTCLALLRLIPRGARIDGTVRFDGVDVASLDAPSIRRLRAKRARVVFQDPWSALNPFMRVGDQLVESLRSAFPDLPREAAMRRAVEMLDRVGIPEASQRARAYPHALSGGMLQRVVIAMALLAEPDLLICDEPTTALDVTTQAQILDLIDGLNREFGTAVIFTTHDLPIAADLCHRVMVMYAGRLVEIADTATIFNHAQHPYTRALLAADPDAAAGRGRLEAIPGNPPAPAAPLPGCAFHPRCALAEASCAVDVPRLLPGRAPGHVFACPVTNRAVAA